MAKRRKTKNHPTTPKFLDILKNADDDLEVKKDAHMRLENLLDQR